MKLFFEDREFGTAQLTLYRRIPRGQDGDLKKCLRAQLMGRSDNGRYGFLGRESPGVETLDNLFIDFDYLCWILVVIVLHYCGPFDMLTP